MAFPDDTRVTVHDTPTLLNNFGQDDGNPGVSMLVYIPLAGQTVFVGGPAVTVAGGYPYFAGTEHPVDIDDSALLTVDRRNMPGEALYGIVAPGTTQVINVLPEGI